jgi:hypothetical protein
MSQKQRKRERAESRAKEPAPKQGWRAPAWLVPVLVLIALCAVVVLALVAKQAQQR